MRPLTGWVLLLSLFPTAAQAGDWEHIFEEEGITVWKKEVEGSDFVAFRGRGPVKASILDVSAVLRDADRETEWMQDCVDARTLQFLSATDAIVYNRTGSPAFFIDDRDTVLKTVTTVYPDKKRIDVVFEQTTHPNMPPKEGVVRMPVLKGHWKLWSRGPDETEVEYQVLADPGGALPAWLVNLVSKKLPYYTLIGLRKQVKEKGYDKHRMILEVAIDWAPFNLAEAKPVQQQPAIGPAKKTNVRVTR